MGTGRQQISDWFDENKEEKNTHMIIVCDTFDWDDYPVGVKASEDVREIAN